MYSTTHKQQNFDHFMKIDEYATGLKAFIFMWSKFESSELYQQTIKIIILRFIQHSCHVLGWLFNSFYE